MYNGPSAVPFYMHLSKLNLRNKSMKLRLPCTLCARCCEVSPRYAFRKELLPQLPFRDCLTQSHTSREQPSSNDPSRQSCNGLATWTHCKPTLVGHFSPQAPVGSLGWGCHLASIMTRLPPLSDPTSAPSLPQGWIPTAFHNKHSPC